MPDPREVFLIHGRDQPARRALRGFLHALDLRPLDWEEIVRRTGSGAPYNGEVLAKAFEQNQAAIVLCTPDDGALLHKDLRGEREPAYEVQMTGQVRPNVLIEAGMALALQPDRTVIVQIGDLRPASDLTGRNTIAFDGSAESLHAIAQRLAAAGCSVDTTGTDWLDTSRFAGLDAYRRHF
jgi:predicted nucleotide-binding protein